MTKKPAHLMTNRLVEQVVTIVGTDDRTGAVMCRDAYGNEFEIDGSVRRKGTGFPMPDERWVLVKRGNVWIADAQIGAPSISTITGARDGLHPVMVQVLEALSHQGLLADGTDGILHAFVPDPPAPEVAVVGDTQGGDMPATWDGNDGAPDNPVQDPILPDLSADPPPAPKPPSATKPPTPHKPPPVVHHPPPSEHWRGLHLCTYNTLKDLGPRTALGDMNRLAGTAAQVIGFQEAHNDDRNGNYNRFAAHGWGVYRPQYASFSDENTIIWRDADFDLQDAGSVYLGRYDIPTHRMPPRYLNWVRLYYHDAARPIYFLDTHYDPHLEDHRGAPRTAAEGAYLGPRLAANFHFIDVCRDYQQRFAKIAPTFLAGDFNIGYEGDSRVRDPRFPYRKFGAIGSHSNWQSVGPQGRHIDQIWGTRLPDWHVRPLQTWVLSGYHSDHRPVLVKYAILSR